MERVKEELTRGLWKPENIDFFSSADFRSLDKNIRQLSFRGTF